MKNKKSARRAALVIAAAAVVCALLAADFCLPLVYPAFSRLSQPEYAYPDWRDGFVPQGITAPQGAAENEVRIICGYMTKEQPSRVYVLRKDAAPVRIALALENGDAYYGHAGGVTAAGDFVYISNERKLFVLRLSDVLSAKDGDTLRFLGQIDVDVNASYCSSDDRMLYVGEYREKGYETDAGHTAASADGELRAYTRAYPLDAAAPLGIKEPAVPARTFATRDAVQGFALLPGGIAVLSCSKGFANSRLYLYRIPEGGGVLPLDSTNLLREIPMPRMSEDLEARGGLLLMGFEAGAKKFGARLLPFGVRDTVRFDAKALTGTDEN